MKLCKKCSSEKPLSEFHNKTTGKHGKASRCKPCSAALNEAYRAANKQKIAVKIAAWHERNPNKKFEYHQKKYERPEGRAMHLLNGARIRRPDGFTLTLQHVIDGMQRGVCAATGLPFDLRVNSDGKGARSFSPFAPSLDKIDSRKPYTNKNTRVVIWQYNVMKGELSDAGLLEICRHIVARAAA